MGKVCDPRALVLRQGMVLVSVRVPSRGTARGAYYVPWVAHQKGSFHERLAALLTIWKTLLPDASPCRALACLSAWVGRCSVLFCISGESLLAVSFLTGRRAGR